MDVRMYMILFPVLTITSKLKFRHVKTKGKNLSLWSVGKEFQPM